MQEIFFRALMHVIMQLNNVGIASFLLELFKLKTLKYALKSLSKNAVLAVVVVRIIYNF
jgi:hypothetical protein